MPLITAARAAEHLRLDDPDAESGYVQLIISAAESHVAQYLQRPLVPWDSLDATVPTPPEVEYAVLLHVADLYENRSANVEKTLSVNPTVDRLLHMHRRGLGV